MKSLFLFLVLLCACEGFSYAEDIDKSIIQQWLINTPIQFQKVKKVAWVFDWKYKLDDKIDVTRVSNIKFKVFEDTVVIKIHNPIPFCPDNFTYGKDTGAALVNFDYIDQEGTAHKAQALCEYGISGVLKNRTITKVTAYEP